jgi:anti-sigma factor RsiW
MSQSACIEKQSLVSYLYGECPEAEQQHIERHLETCVACAADVRELQDVRDQLVSWAPPEAELGFQIPSPTETSPSAAWWRVPVWAQALAAVLVLMMGATAANLQIQYGQDGFVVRTGWSAPNPSTSPAASAAAPWRPELAALEQQLRREFSQSSIQSVSSRPGQLQTVSAGTGVAVNIPHADPEVIRRVKSLVDESEKKQQRELALRLAQLYREMDLQRRADLQRIEDSFGQIEGQTGAAIAQQREWLNHLVRASSQRR